MIGSSLVILLTISSILSYTFITDTFELPTSLCSFLGHFNKSLLSKIVTILTFLCQTVSCVIIPITYYFLLQKVNEAKAAVDHSSKQNDNKDLKKTIVVAFTDLLSWVPSSVLLLLTMLWKEYPYEILIWTTMFIIPLNAILNPFVFVFFKLLKECLKPVNQ